MNYKKLCIEIELRELSCKTEFTEIVKNQKGMRKITNVRGRRETQTPAHTKFYYFHVCTSFGNGGMNWTPKFTHMPKLERERCMNIVEEYSRWHYEGVANDSVNSRTGREGSREKLLREENFGTLDSDVDRDSYL